MLVSKRKNSLLIASTKFGQEDALESIKFYRDL